MAGEPNSIELNAKEIVVLKERAETAARSAEEASSKANSESGFAYNAKQVAEEHAKAISQLKGQVDADMGWLTTTKKNAEDALNVINSAKSTVEANIRLVTEMTGKIEERAEASTLSISKGAEALALIERTGDEVASTLEAIKRHSTEVAGLKAETDKTVVAVEALRAQSEELASQITETNTAASSNGKEIETNKKNSEILLASIEKATTTANATQVRVGQYEIDLKELKQSFQELHQKIEGLLPNATSAGLASAFRNQKERFKKPQRQWLATFVISIILLLAAGLTGLPGGWAGLWSSTATVPAATWDVILRQLMVRLPLIAPLVWLGVYAGRNYMLALRVEEEYAFKEAVSTAFEGYKREMAGISGSGDMASPLLVLCENVLRALSQRPGRIYEGRHEDITPLSPVRAVLQDAQKVVKAVKGNSESEE